VAPRDGLQNQAKIVAPATRARLANRLAASGVPRIEAASFVSPRRVPQMAGAEEVVLGLEPRGEVVFAGLVVNERGFKRLTATTLREVHMVVGCTETFNKRNQGVSVLQSMAAAGQMVDQGHAQGLRVTVTFAVAFGCPFEGHVDPGRVAELAAELAGADELAVADTIGVAGPRQVRALIERVASIGPRVGAHFHNTRNTGYANAIAALAAGATVLEASLGGIGGCPFAPGATGNIATEDLAYLLDCEGLDTGVDIDALIELARWLEGVLGQTLDGQLYRIGRSL
jgi:isopropylmalate/homocitrate/citramalate synthase